MTNAKLSITSFIAVALTTGVLFAWYGTHSDSGGIRAAVDQYCIDCHNSFDLAGDVDFTALDPTRVHDDLLLWETAARKLRSGEMPPPDARPIENEQRQAQLAALAVGLADIDNLPADERMVSVPVDRSNAEGEPRYARTIDYLTDTSLAESQLRNAITYNAESTVILSAPASSLARSLEIVAYRDTPYDIAVADLAAMVYAVERDDSLMRLSAPGRIESAGSSLTFREGAEGGHRQLLLPSPSELELKLIEAAAAEPGQA